MSTAIIDAMGLIGVSFIVAAYFLLQTGYMENESPRYSILNLVGAALILVSLTQNFNLPAAIVEVFWVAISLVGLVRSLRSQPGASD